MNKWWNEWIDRWMYEWIDGWINELVDEWVANKFERKLSNEKRTSEQVSYLMEKELRKWTDKHNEMNRNYNAKMGFYSRSLSLWCVKWTEPYDCT